MAAFLKLAPVAIVLVSFALDRITKLWIQKALYYGQTVDLLPFFRLTYIENTGAAFGLGQDRNGFFIFVSIVILLVLLVYGHRLGAGNWKMKCAIALVAGGALGNLYDRIVYRSVVDFLDFFAGSYHWPAFNVADACICAGAALVAVLHWKDREREEVRT